MNAKKIMGAVLVALLAAALFVGAGAAAGQGTVFVYELTDTDLGGTWTLGASTIVGQQYNSQWYFAGENIVEGTYKNTADTDKTIVVKYPTATISGVANVGSTDYMVLGGTYYKGDNLTISAKSDATVSPALTIGNLLVTYPNGTVVAKDITSGGWKIVDAGVTVENDLPVGQYKIQAQFTDKTQFAPGTPVNYLNAKAVYTMTVANSGDVTISSEAATVIESEAFTAVLTGKPGSTQTITVEKVDLVSVNGAAPVANATAGYDVVIPNTGKVTLYLKAGTETGTGKVKVGDKSVSVTIVAGTITAKADKESYFIGDTAKLTGTSTAGNALSLYIAGTNVNLKNLNIDIAVDENGEWKHDLTYDEMKGTLNKLDAGTYTVYVSNKDVTVPADVNLTSIKSYTTVAVILKQPFISVTDAPAVAVKGTDYVVKGTAEATDKIYVYVFGTNFFAAKGEAVLSESSPVGPITITTSFEENEFTIEATIPETSTLMATGQYFMVIQHPMYDEKFNIWANGTDINTAPTVGSNYGVKQTLFDVSDRQNANAAQALCDALDTQNIDDMYVKLSFIVANPTSTINPIPSEITQGSKLTVSGTTNLGEGKVVTVEMLSTAFAAIPKENVGSASFIALSTETDENGNWEVTFDTSNLNADEYSVSVAVESIDSTSTKVNVIEGAPTEQPTTQPTETQQPTTQPTETTAPTTPGFGALAALAGLGAVAVLLLRRE